MAISSAPIFQRVLRQRSIPRTPCGLFSRRRLRSCSHCRSRRACAHADAILSNTRKLLISAVAVGLVFLAWFVTGHYELMSRLLLPPLGEIANTAEELWTDGSVHVPLWQDIAV